MNIFSNIIDSLQIVYGKAEVKEVLRPFEFEGETVPKNILIQLNKGSLFVGKDSQPMKEGEFYFVPAGANIYARFGKGAKYLSVSPESFDAADGSCLHMNTVNSYQHAPEKNNFFTVFRFSTSLYKTVPFFSLLDLTPFQFQHDEELSFFLQQLCREEAQDKIGKPMLLKNYSSEIVIHLIRYLSGQKQFSENVEKINYLLDTRLVKIIQYIQGNLDKDLSNKRLAEIAFLSDDYISQFFKSLTHRNLQDYVEEQRLKKARELVMSTSESMKEISLRVGFKDPAYFSRRFKNKFELKATAIRKADRILNEKVNGLHAVAAA